MVITLKLFIKFKSNIRYQYTILFAGFDDNMKNTLKNIPLFW